MAFKLVKRNKLRVPVKGSIPDEGGAQVKFDFTLLCKRLVQSEIDVVLADKEALTHDFLHQVTEGWEGVFSETGDVLEFSAEALDLVLEQPAMRSICFGAYLKEVGAVAKN